MPEPINTRQWRSDACWRVVETRSHVLMSDCRLESDLTPLTRHMDEITETVCTALLVQQDDKHEETFLKSHVWVYHPDVLHVPGASVRRPNNKMFYGTADSAGIHLVARNLPWDSPQVLDHVLHEVVHAIWGNIVGEAPSLLNEGIAAWIERRYTHQPHPRLPELDTAWKQALRGRSGWLAPLMINDGFWRAIDDGLDAYAVGGYLTRAIVEHHGHDALAAIFRDTTYEDEHLADVLQRHLGASPGALETLAERT